VSAHPREALAAYAANDVGAEEGADVERHLAGCAACRTTVADFRALLDELATAAPAPPELAWPRYRAELRARLASRRRASWRARWLRPVPAAAVTAVAAAVAIVVYAALPAGRPADLAAIEYDGLAGRLPLIDHYQVVEQLDLLEDLDVIRNLDQLSPTREG
jgi:anti-sigma factor RsiW